MTGNNARKILTLFLSFSIALSSNAAFVLAAGETETDPAGTNGTTQDAPATDPVNNSEGGDQQGGGETTPSGETEPDDPVDPPAEVHKLEGVIYEYEYYRNQGSAVPSKQTFTVALANGSKTITPSSDGSFELELEEAQVKESGEYDWSFSATDKYLSASGTLKENETSKLYIKERYEPNLSDFIFAASPNIIGGVFKGPGTYTITPAEGKKLSKTLDGTAASSLEIEVAADGSIPNIYIYTGNDCSQMLSTEKVKLDDGPPVVGAVNTAAAKDDTYVKTHGIYSKTQADILVKAEITEKGVGLSKVYLIGEKDGVRKTYEPVASDGEKGEYTYSIALPDEETLLEAQKMLLVAEDKFGNRSTETLIAASEDGSSVTLESIAPALERTLSSSANARGWYNKLPSITAVSSDLHSGLASLSISEDGKVLESSTFEDKTNAEHELKAAAVIEEASDDGTYHFSVKAKDNSGNVKTDDFDLKIDLVAPVISASGVKNGTHYRSVPNIHMEEDEKYYNADGAYLRYRIIKDNVREIASKSVDKVNELTVPGSLMKEDGEYSVVLIARDAAGNTSNEIIYEFVKDSTAPVVKWSGVQDGKFYNKKQTPKLTVTEKWYRSNKVSVSGTRKLGNSSNGVSFPWSNKAETSTSSKTFSETGTYTLTASATDEAGNSSGTKKISFTIDTKAPEIKITGVRDGGIYTYGQGLAPKAEVTDDYLDSKSISFTKAGRSINNPSFEQIKENDGLYTMTVSARDKAGNTASKTISFTVNRFGSYFEYNDAVKNVMGKALQNVDEDLVITEKNISKLESSDRRVYRDGKAITNDSRTSGGNADDTGYNTYQHTFGKEIFSEEGAYEVNVVSKDEAGNEMESKEENGRVVFYVDRTEPSLTVTGIDPKGNKAESITVTAKADDLLTGVDSVTATVDGQPVSVTDNGDGTYTFTVNEGLRQDIEVTATDKAGNAASYSETASVSASAVSLFFDRFGKLLGIGAAALAAACGILLFIKRRKSDDDEDESDEESAE